MTDTRKPNRVSLTSGSSESRESHSPTKLSLGIEEMEVIQYPERIDSGCLADLTLLPIHPPEIHTLIFERVVHSLEVSIKEL